MNTGCRQELRCAVVLRRYRSHVLQDVSQFHAPILVTIPHTEQRRALSSAAHTRCKLRLRIGLTERSCRHPSPHRSISFRDRGSGRTRELDERKHRFFYREVFRHRCSRNPCFSSDSPTITLAAILASGTPVALETKGTVRDARGFTSSR